MPIRPKGKEPNPRIVYADIIDMPRHSSTKHPHMSLYDRAAQFMPFSALTGYEDMINEEVTHVNETTDVEHITDIDDIFE